MAEVAALGLKVDGVADIERAQGALDDFTKSAEGAERAATKSGKSTRTAGGSMKKAGTDAATGSKGVDRLTKSTEDLNKAAVNVKAALTGAFLGVSVASVLIKIATETRNAEQEQAQLAAVLKSTSNAAGFTQQALNDMADAMSHASTVSSGEINQAQTTLLAFTGIVGEQFTTALQAAVDMAARTGMSVVSAAETIGRALDVPSQGLTALSRQGFRFTDDQKKLAEQLEATGRTAEAQGIVLSALQESYGGAARAARDTFGGALAGLQNEINNLLTGSDGSFDGLTGAINDLTGELQSDYTRQGFATFIGLLADVSRNVVRLIGDLGNATNKAGSFVDAISSFSPYDSIASLWRDSSESLAAANKEVAELEAMQQRLNNGTARWNDYNQKSLDFAMKAAKVRQAQYQREVNRQESDVASQYLGAGETGGSPVVPTMPAVTVPGAPPAKPTKPTGGGRQTTELENYVKQLQLQQATLGMTTEQAERYRIETAAGSEADRQRALAMFDVVRAFEEAQKVQESYRSLVESLRTPEEKATETLKERLAVLDAMKVSSEEYAKVAGRIVGNAFSEAPKAAGVTVDMGGVSSELGRIEESRQELETWYSTQLEMLNTFRQQRADLNTQWDEQELALKQQYEKQQTALSRSEDAVRTASAEEAFGSMADVARTFFGEQSGLYKAMFAIEKSYAIGKVLMNAPKTASDAYAAMAGIPVVGPALGVAAAAAALTYQLAQASSINSINMTGMAHDGIDSVPETGTWLLQKGERVTTANTSAKLDSVLERIDARQRGARASQQEAANQNFRKSSPTVNLIEDRSRAGTVQTREGVDREEIIDIFVADIRGGGRSADALEMTYPVRRMGR